MCGVVRRSAVSDSREVRREGEEGIDSEEMGSLAAAAAAAVAAVPWWGVEKRLARGDGS
jgi:hypothetical protein